MLYRWNLILNSNEDLARFRQKQILRHNRNKNLQKQNNEDLFIQLLNSILDGRLAVRFCLFLCLTDCSSAF